MRFRRIIMTWFVLSAIAGVLFVENSHAADSKVPGALARYKKGAKLAQNHDYTGAVEEYNKAIAIDSNYLDAINSRGVANAKLMKFESAVDDFTKVIRMNPKSAEPYHNRGMVLVQLRKYDLAIADFDSAIKLNNRDAFVLSKARALESAGRKKEAVASYRAFINHRDLKLNKFVDIAKARIRILSGDDSEETIISKVDDSVRMVRSVYRFEGPVIKDAPFLAIPRKIWRVGKTYMRAEEELNMSTGARTLMIVSEPDYWLINRDIYAGQHGVDNGPTFNTVAPVLSKFASVYSDSLLAFELCREKEFFEQRKAALAGKRTIDDVACDVYELPFGDFLLSLFLRQDNGEPWMVSLTHEDEPVLVVRYDEYQSNMKPDLSLFRPPAGTTITEIE